MTRFSKTLLTLLVLLLASVSVHAQAIPEKKMGAYLFTYFNDATHSLFMAISYDGYTFKALNGSDPIVAGDTIAEQRGIRDPHLYRSPKDGEFYLVLTDLHIYGKEKGLRTTQR